jgi:hypothetical protein
VLKDRLDGFFLICPKLNEWNRWSIVYRGNCGLGS